MVRIPSYETTLLSIDYPAQLEIAQTIMDNLKPWSSFDLPVDSSLPTNSSNTIPISNGAPHFMFSLSTETDDIGFKQTTHLDPAIQKQLHIDTAKARHIRKLPLKGAPTQHVSNSPAYKQAQQRANKFHQKFHVGADRMEKARHVLTDADLRFGDSFYLEPCTHCWRGENRHPHKQVDTRLPESITKQDKAGNRWGVDGAYVPAYSEWGKYNHILLFMDYVSKYGLAYFTHTTNATEFIRAVKWVKNITKLLMKSEMRDLHADALSAYLSKHITTPWRIDNSINLHISPPYVKHKNHELESFIQRLEKGTRIRLSFMIDKEYKGRLITDPIDLFPWAAVHWIQGENATLQRIYGIYVSPLQAATNQVTVPQKANLHPFGTVALLLRESKEHHKYELPKDIYYYLCNAGLDNMLVNNYVEHSAAHVALNKENGRIRITGKLTFPYLLQPFRPTTALPQTKASSTTESNTTQRVTFDLPHQRSSHTVPLPTEVPASTTEPVVESTESVDESNNPLAIPSPIIDEFVTNETETTNDINESIENTESNTGINQPWYKDTTIFEPLPQTVITPGTAPRDKFTSAILDSEGTTVTHTDAAPPDKPPRVPSGFNHAASNPKLFDSDLVLPRLKDMFYNQQHLTLCAGRNRPKHTKDNNRTERRLNRLSSETIAEYRAKGHSLSDFRYDISKHYLTFRDPALSKLHNQGGLLWSAVLNEGEIVNALLCHDSVQGEKAISHAFDSHSMLSKPAQPELSDIEFKKLITRTFLCRAAENYRVTPEQCYLCYRYHLRIAEHNGTNDTYNNNMCFNYACYQSMYDTVESCLLSRVENTHLHTGEYPSIVLQLHESNGNSNSTNGPTSAHPDVTLDKDEYLVQPDDVRIEELEIKELKGITDPADRIAYLKAICKEVMDIVRFGCFKLALPPPDSKPIDSKIILKIKVDGSGNYLKHKARMVLKGFLSNLGSDFFGSFAPMSMMTTTRSLFALAARYNLKVWHSDVPNAFVQALIDTDVSVKLPKGIYLDDPDSNKFGNGRIPMLIRSLYGLRSAPLNWSREVNNFFMDNGFTRCQSDSCLYTKTDTDGTWITVNVNVDDILCCGTSDKYVEELRTTLKNKYSVEMFEEVKTLLGMNVQRYEDGSFSLDVTAKIKQIYEDHPMLNQCLPSIYPMTQNTPKDGEPSTALELYIKHNFSSLVGSLIYLSTTCRPDLTQALGRCSRGMHSPTYHHIQILEQIFKYLKKPENRALKLFFRHDGAPTQQHFREISMDKPDLQTIVDPTPEQLKSGNFDPGLLNK
eukprot:CAMPEP_0197341088 /NCGR_PEP_ID=MMETSP0892-20130614/46048_1 /TAXON_ID=44058 ORGANISM="Aureoumbra lagunensis, Strain CCMP1510" /NCGR_SAMPLE_ID=MMETSP0892 /ASSEMBLY_ACC=CAM_ASM_000538 /LENGTH=1284 /DNA_ID=CAMNT_0042845965 /DNA_START=532 /DNA_END=4386 /DNA_ORIENTATION=-